MRESLQSVGKALAVVELLADRGEMSLQEISGELLMPRTSTHRVLAKLREHAYVSQNLDNARYRLGPALWELAMRVPQTARAYEFAMPPLQRLAKHLHRLTVLAVYDEGDILAIARAVPHGEEYIAQPVAARSPAYCSAVGKVALAFQSPLEIERVLHGELVSYTAATIADPGRLQIELERIRQRGYATNCGEHQVDVCGVGAPVFDGSGRLVATVGVSCPCDDYTEGFVQGALPSMLEAARAISVAFGFRGAGREQAALA